MHTANLAARFPLRGADRPVSGVLLPACWVPFWVANACYGRYVAQGGRQPSAAIYRAGGFPVLQFLDLMRGGKGWETPPMLTAFLVHHRTLSTREFPVLGAPVTDGTKVPPSTIPEWLAEYAHHAYRTSGRPDVTNLETLRKVGGFGGNQLLDLLAGGNSDGQAWTRVLNATSSPGKGQGAGVRINGGYPGTRE